MYFAVRQIGAMTWAVQYWNRDGKCHRSVVQAKDRANFVKTLQEQFDVNETQAWNATGYLVLNVPALAKQLPGIQRMVTHPVRKKEVSLWSCIMDLNDNHNWSREQIADWIESLDDVPTFEPKKEIF